MVPARSLAFSTREKLYTFIIYYLSLKKIASQTAVPHDNGIVLESLEAVQTTVSQVPQSTKNTPPSVRN